jgi:hypothetical protein
LWSQHEFDVDHLFAASFLNLIESVSSYYHFIMGFFELRGRALITVILMISGIDFLLFGYDQGLFGGILAGDRFTEMLGRRQYNFRRSRKLY